MLPTYPAGLMWFRRDLRAHDNAALYRALRACGEVHAAFVFDRAILDALPRADRRVEFIRESVLELDAGLRAAGGAKAGLIVRHAAAVDDIPQLAHELGVQAVFANHDDEPQAIERDEAVRAQLARAGIALHTFKDHAIFGRDELLTQAGHPYSVFTPYRKAWLAKADSFYLRPYAVHAHAHRLAPRPARFGTAVPSLGDLGFAPTNFAALGIPAGTSGGRRLFDEFRRRIDRYDVARDFPAVRGPSYLGVHLRFGTVSIRELAGEAHRLAAAGSGGAATWLSELVWRDFYFQVLANFPHVAQGCFRREFDRIEWEAGPQADEHFAAWCAGRTGYPLVDAAMAQINQTGYMHNRLRMVTASFLTKDLGIDWRRGERWFAQQLNDYDLAANNGGWQWAASTGCDAQPFFRIFNPVSQGAKFDPQGKFILRYLPQLAGLQGDALQAPWLAGSPPRDYPPPIVDHAAARERTLRRYEAARKANGA